MLIPLQVKIGDNPEIDFGKEPVDVAIVDWE